MGIPSGRARAASMVARALNSCLLPSKLEFRELILWILRVWMLASIPRASKKIAWIVETFG